MKVLPSERESGADDELLLVSYHPAPPFDTTALTLDFILSSVGI